MHAKRRSVPIAVCGATPKKNTSKGVINAPPPTPVKPTSTPTIKPATGLSASTVFLRECRFERGDEAIELGGWKTIDAGRELASAAGGEPATEMVGRSCGIRRYPNAHGVGAVARGKHRDGTLRITTAQLVGK